ncbi:probable mitochondrial import inner membrane translocase subunit TIM21 [Mangifera indica]|uniref:probable mitochondrial import inner membrane translocase subunit TIM21 n=1 Tax=Mangifera indica TaxID=29780 RepID=UPI001CFA376F|nr:probable mitochondrial import inner membrane translocase subunit TIM21 [Mangifera indica]XP_044491674.1 probable mitochondrial import inner membrane translocase subunit TIM21 [Mangifera indica]XP_044491675.1 probable mitochondrial import inner membrane translocase subunit TIM21 [Mangifera indica]
MYNFRRSAISSLRRTCFLARFSSPSNTKSAAEYLENRDAFGANGISLLVRGLCTGGYMVDLHSPYKLMDNHVANTGARFSARSFASKPSKQTSETSSEPKKDISTIEDPFDAPTYNIPEKPVTFTEGASYSVIILAGLGIAAAAAYAVFKELIFEPKEYKIFNKALKRIQDDGQVRVRIGSPITGYGQESRNRAARQRIPNRIYTDEFGIEHVEVNFYIRGPHGAGKVFTEMFKDQEDKQWKFTYLIVEINSPYKAQLMLESYMPAPASGPA